MLDNVSKSTSPTPPSKDYEESSPLRTSQKDQVAVQDTSLPIFQAKASVPQKSKVSLCLIDRVLPFVFFPLGIYYLINKILQNNIGKLVFPAPKHFQDTHQKEYWKNHKQRILDNPNSGCSSLQIKTADGVKLDSAILWNDQKLVDAYKKDPLGIDLSGEKWVVCFNGNCMCYESFLHQAAEYRSKTGYNVLLFNYRGVLESEGTAQTADDLTLDGDAFIQYLRAHGVKREDILLHGISLGGGVATQVGALNPEVSIDNYQSFSSIGGVVKGIVDKALTMNGKSNLVARGMANVIGLIATKLLEEAGWNLDSAREWSKIKGYKWIVSADEDRLITGPGKLYKALKSQLEGYIPVKNKDDPQNAAQVALNRKLKATLNHVRSPGTSHCGPLAKKAYRHHIAHMKKALNHAAA